MAAADPSKQENIVTAVANTPAASIQSEFYRQIELDPSPNDPKRLTFVAAPGAGPVPDNMRMLRRDYEETARIVSVLFADKPELRKEIVGAI
jgi:hypothetical protein